MEFKKAYDECIDYPCCPGDKIYHWTYINDDGVEVTESKNIFEEIQSYERITNYKELIENYGGIDNLPAAGNAGIYADVSGFGSNPDTAREYLIVLLRKLGKLLPLNKQKQLKSWRSKRFRSSRNSTK